MTWPNSRHQWHLPSCNQQEQLSFGRLGRRQTAIGFASVLSAGHVPHPCHIQPNSILWCAGMAPAVAPVPAKMPAATLGLAAGHLNIFLPWRHVFAAFGGAGWRRWRTACGGRSIALRQPHAVRMRFYWQTCQHAHCLCSLLSIKGSNLKLTTTWCCGSARTIKWNSRASCTELCDHHPITSSNFSAWQKHVRHQLMLLCRTHPWRHWSIIDGTREELGRFCLKLGSPKQPPFLPTNLHAWDDMRVRN